MAENQHLAGFGLYVHWPFCEAKCPYCDFNSHVVRNVDQATWSDALVRELDRVGLETPGRVLNSVYFGGGTPSLMHPRTVASVLGAARQHWPFANDVEITLEANPGSVEAARFAGYREAGVNRVSLGVQALDDDDLRRLGRIHDADQARSALETARDCFDRVSFDLIYARQGQSLSAWKSELSLALDLAADHLSLYQLTIEPGTAFGDRHARGWLRGLPGDDLSADMFHLTQEICDARGLPAYEVSNHAGPGAESRHNLIYWRGGDYAGIGPGAHGRLTHGTRRFATETHTSPQTWLAAVSAGSGESSRTVLNGQARAEEYLMMGLRLSEGIDPIRFGALAGAPLAADRLADLEQLGMIDCANGRITATPNGRAVLNALLRTLLAG